MFGATTRCAALGTRRVLPVTLSTRQIWRHNTSAPQYSAALTRSRSRGCGLPSPWPLLAGSEEAPHCARVNRRLGLEPVHWPGRLRAKRHEEAGEPQSPVDRTRRPSRARRSAGKRGSNLIPPARASRALSQRTPSNRPQGEGPPPSRPGQAAFGVLDALGSGRGRVLWVRGCLSPAPSPPAPLLCDGRTGPPRSRASSGRQRGCWPPEQPRR